MKKLFFLAAMLSFGLLFTVAVGPVNAADVGYVCTINYIGAGQDGVGIFNVTCPAKDANQHWYISEAASYKSYLAIGLTASSLGKNVWIVLASPAADWQPIKQFYLMP
jgi:hypothetical protein